jgi:hypothetical protein
MGSEYTGADQAEKGYLELVIDNLQCSAQCAEKATANPLNEFEQEIAPKNASERSAALRKAVEKHQQQQKPPSK